MVPSRLLTCSDLKLFLNKTILDMIYIWKNSITNQLSINGLAAHSQDHDAQASIDGLGVAKFSQKGTATDGVMQIKLQGEGEYTDIYFCNQILMHENWILPGHSCS